VQPSPAGVKLLCGQFAFNTNAVLTGDDDGSVAVYELFGFEQHPDDQVTTADMVDSTGTVLHSYITLSFSHLSCPTGTLLQFNSSRHSVKVKVSIFV